MTAYADLVRPIRRAPRTGTGVRLAVDDVERLAAMLDTLDAATEAAHDDSGRPSSPGRWRTSIPRPRCADAVMAPRPLPPPFRIHRTSPIHPPPSTHAAKSPGEPGRRAIARSRRAGPSHPSPAEDHTHDPIRPRRHARAGHNRTKPRLNSARSLLGPLLAEPTCGALSSPVLPGPSKQRAPIRPSQAPGET